MIEWEITGAVDLNGFIKAISFACQKFGGNDAINNEF